jgi:hypothetical protein
LPADPAGTALAGVGVFAIGLSFVVPVPGEAPR